MTFEEFVDKVKPELRKDWERSQNLKFEELVVGTFVITLQSGFNSLYPGAIRIVKSVDFEKGQLELGSVDWHTTTSTLYKQAGYWFWDRIDVITPEELASVSSMTQEDRKVWFFKKTNKTCYANVGTEF